MPQITDEKKRKIARRNFKITVNKVDEVCLTKKRRLEAIKKNNL